MTFTNPLEASETVVCTGTYTLTADDIENLRREGLVTVEAKDEHGYHVGLSVPTIVTLDQARTKCTFEHRIAVTIGQCTCLFADLSKRGSPMHFNFLCPCRLIAFGYQNVFNFEAQPQHAPTIGMLDFAVNAVCLFFAIGTLVDCNATPRI